MSGDPPAVQVGMAPFVAPMSDPVALPNGRVGVVVNCGIHASRVVGKGGAKIHDLMSRTGATMRVAKTSGACEITGTPDEVDRAKRAVLEIVEDGDGRDLRAAVSQALRIGDDARGGLVVAPPLAGGAAGVHATWAEADAPPSEDEPFVPPTVTKTFEAPLALR
jgi:hypothetical protein